MRKATSASCGGEHSLFVDSDGNSFSSGACGLGWHGSQRIPLPSIEKVVGGYYHSFAISRSGKLFSWACGNFGGLNDGQLGHTDFREGTDPEEVTLPSMAASETVVDARAGCYHSAVLTSAGRVFSFGLNNYGQLGRSGLKRSDPVPRPPGTEGYADGRPLPVELPATVAMGCADGDGASKSSGAEVAPNASCIGAGFYNTFFFRNDQVGVLCAGSNAAGQCGSAAATSERFEKIPELDVAGPMAAVAGGYCHTLALAASGKLFALGCGEDGQRGDRRLLDDDADDDGDDEVAGCKVPMMNQVLIAGRSRVVEIAAGANHSLAVTEDRTSLFGWGSNDAGQIGDAASDEGTSTPTQIKLPDLKEGDTIAEVSAGYSHSLVRTAGGDLFAFGAGTNGQLGQVSAEAVDSSKPLVVTLPTNDLKKGWASECTKGD
eukprot:gene6167-13267_t